MRLSRIIVTLVFTAAVLGMLSACGGQGETGSFSPAVAPQLAQHSAAHANSTTSCVVARCIYVAKLCPVTVYPAGADGNASPVESLACGPCPFGRCSGLHFVQGIAVDASHNIYITNATQRTPVTPRISSVFVYGANGNLIRTISGSNTGFSGGLPWGIAVDARGSIYVTETGRGCCIFVFTPLAHGNVAPARVISGSKTHLNGAAEIAVDVQGRMFVGNFNSDCSASSVSEFAANANGNVAPIRTIGGSNTGLSCPQIALGPGGAIYAANAGAADGTASVTIYAATATGDVKPVRTIAGSKTGLDVTSGIAVDTSGLIYVANFVGGTTGTGSVNVYSAAATGDATPLRSISGANTGIRNPWNLAVR